MQLELRLFFSLDIFFFSFISHIHFLWNTHTHTEWKVTAHLFMVRWVNNNLQWQNDNTLFNRLLVKVLDIWHPEHQIMISTSGKWMYSILEMNQLLAFAFPLFPLCVVYWLINSEWSFIFKDCNYTGEQYKDRGVAVIHMHSFKHTSGSGCISQCVCESSVWVCVFLLTEPIYSCRWPNRSHHMPL